MPKEVENLNHKLSSRFANHPARCLQEQPLPEESRSGATGTLGWGGGGIALPRGRNGTCEGTWV